MQNRQPPVISPIALDLGARYTGVFTAEYTPGELPENQTNAYTLSLPEEDGRMTWSQVNRTATRHRIRSNKRRKYAKRLLQQALRQLLAEHQLDLSGAEWERLWQASSGLMNRRGYNRIETEEDLTPLSEVDPDMVSTMLPDFFHGASPIYDQWESLSQDITMVREINQHGLLQKSVNDIKKAVKQEFGGQETVSNDLIKQTADALKLIRNGASDILSQLDFGHQHRADYLNDIRKEISKDSRFKPLTQMVGDDSLWRLIGNISNLQLRTLRWYLNDQAMVTGDQWKPAALKKTLRRWLQFWRAYEDDEKQRQREALTLIESEQPILNILQQLDPHLTIPPYEDQDNRRPPKDQTLLLNPLALDQQYPKWTVWVQKLLTRNPGWDGDLDRILGLYDRKSRLPKTVDGQRIESPYKLEALKLSYVLQRLLDRNVKLDDYALRGLAKVPEEQRGEHLQRAAQRLSEDLGSQHVADFLALANHYYNEVNLARQGLWLERKHCILEPSRLNPPHKTKILPQLVGNVLGVQLSDPDFQLFRESLWRARVKGNSTLKGICSRVEETRKTYGNLFNERLRRLRYHIEQDGKPEKEVLTDKDKKDIWKAWQHTQLAVQFIADNLQHTEQQQQRYANPFSLAQLYNLLEKDPRGFSNTTLAVHLEQAWRMSEVEAPETNRKVARCSRLAADSVRPFDGVLRRVLEHQAHAIALAKVAEMQRSDARNCIYTIPVLVEENRFSFSEQLKDLKKAPAAEKRKLNEKLHAQRDMWEEKHHRLIKASQDICPYTGKAIGQHGEIDHIIPRSQTSKNTGTILNSEANLIWCSREGNQTKKDERSRLTDLASAYLQKLFGTTSVQEVAQYIEKTVAGLPDDFVFDSLELKQQAAVRHALFLEDDSPAREQVIRKLGTQNMARVNGTQAYLVRKIIEHIESLSKKLADERSLHIQYEAARLQAERVHQIRSILGQARPDYAKGEQQSVASHALDAACVFAEAAATPGIANTMALGEVLKESPDELCKVIPDNMPIHWIERRPRDQKTNIASQPLFKEGIYGEHFLPVWEYQNKLSVGFDLYQALPVTGKKPKTLLERLEPFAEVTKAGDGDSTPRKYEINKGKAFAFFQRIAKQPYTVTEALQAKALEALHYTTAKKEVWPTLLDSQGRKFETPEKILHKKNFTVKVQLSDRKAFKVDGKLLLPAYHDWSGFLAHPSIAPLLGTKPDKMPDSRTILQDYFKPGSKRHHDKTRRVFSLPRVDSPSGGFRICRRTPDGRKTWQLHAIEGSPAAGFGVYDGKINWSDTVLLSQLRDSQNVVPVGGRYSEPPEQIVGFTDWLPITQELPGVTQLEMAPGTKDRCYIRITQPFSEFARWAAAAVEDWSITHPYGLRHELKVNDKAFAAEHGISLLGSPRSNLFFTQLGEQVTYWYIVNSANKEMREAYQKAFNSFKS